MTDEMDELTLIHFFYSRARCLQLSWYAQRTKGRLGGQTARQTDREADRQADREIDRHTGKVVGIRDEGDVDIEAQIPIIDYIGVAPVRTATSIIASQGTPGSGAVDGGSVPTGTVFAVLGDVSE